MKKTQSGFTLIEIVVVLAVTAILAAILVPFLYPYAINAKAAALKKDIDTIEAGLWMFNIDNKGSFPLDNDPEPDDQCGNEADIDLVGNFETGNSEENDGDGNSGTGDEGLIYNKGYPYLDPKRVPQKSPTGGTILYKIDNFGDFFKKNKKDIALIITVCPGASSYEEVFRALDDFIDHADGAKKGLVFSENAEDDDDFSNDLTIVIIPDVL